MNWTRLVLAFVGFAALVALFHEYFPRDRTPADAIVPFALVGVLWAFGAFGKKKPDQH